MKATVDKELCTGCGLCEETCPDVFVLDGETAKVKVDIVPQGAEDTCRQAAEECPVEAITVTD